MPLVLALDQSTSASKALLFSESGEVIDRESKEHAQLYPKPGWVEHDAEEIWRNCVDVLNTVVTRQADRMGEVVCLSITNQRETIVVFDKATGFPLYNALVWQCRRGVDLCEEAVDDGHCVEVVARTGLKIDAYFSASKLKWLIRNEPEIARKLREGEALIGTIDAYLIYRLTYGRNFVTDTTNASRTLLFDIGKLRWDEELCSIWDVPIGALPEVRDCEADFGETNLGGRLSRPLRICGVMGDSQAALFAQGCYEVGSGKVTFGTGSSILLNIGAKKLIPDEGLMTSLAWTRNGSPTYALEGIVISAGATLAWLKNQLGIYEDAAEIEAAVRSLDGNGGVYLVPAFAGLGFPYWKADARAAIVGLSSHSDRRHVLLAGLESIAYQIHDAMAAMRDLSSVPLKRLNADGGPTSNLYLMQLVADLCGLEISVAPVSECSALGAALMGMLGAGAVGRPEDVDFYGSARSTFLPSMEPQRRSEMLEGWNKAVAQTIGWQHAANLEAAL